MPRPQALHAQLVDDLLRRGLVAGDVEAAFRAVPRHLFLKGFSAEEVYRDQAIITRKDAAGFGTSSSSQPAIMAVMLRQLELVRGQRVVEIGAGTGYNAALMAHLVGSEGMVTALEIDPEVATEAIANLAAAGVTNVDVVTADGGRGWPAGAPYDRLIATCGVEEIPPVWWDQLRPEGRLVVPLEIAAGVMYSCSLAPAQGRLESLSVEPCGFMPMRGEFGSGKSPGTRLLLAAGVALSLSAPPGFDAEQACAWLSAPQSSTPASVDSEPGLRPWLALAERRTCTLFLQGDAVKDLSWPAVIRSPGSRGGYGYTFGLFADTGLALLDSTDGGFVVRGYGTCAELAERLLDRLGEWHRLAATRAAAPRLRIHRGRSRVRAAPGEQILRRAHSTIVLAW